MPGRQEEKEIRVFILTAIVAVTMLISGMGMFFYRDIFLYGKLCQKHARFEHRCEECHVSWTGASVGKCSGTCHARLKIRDEKHTQLNINCMICHQDHLGLNYDSSLLANKRCIECHRDFNHTEQLTNKILVLVDKKTRQLNELIKQNVASIINSPTCPYLYSRHDCISCHKFHLKKKEEEDEYEGYEMYPTNNR